MSLAELKERLALLKEAQQTEQQEKREHILEVRQNKKQLLLEQMDTIDLHRRALAQAAVVRSGKRLALALEPHTNAQTGINGIFGMLQERGEKSQAGLSADGDTR